MEKEKWKEQNGNVLVDLRLPHGLPKKSLQQWTERHSLHHSAQGCKSGKSKLQEEWAVQPLNADASEEGGPVTDRSFRFSPQASQSGRNDPPCQPDSQG